MGQFGKIGQISCVFLAFALKWIKAMILVCSLKCFTLVVSKGGFSRSYSCSSYSWVTLAYMNTAGTHWNETGELMMDARKGNRSAALGWQSDKGFRLRVHVGPLPEDACFRTSPGEWGDKEVKSRDNRGVDAAGTEVLNIVSFLLKVGLEIFRRNW